ncbi:MAG: dipeptidase [Candidatus Limnocylindria bacterium]
MPAVGFVMARQTDRVPSMKVKLDRDQERRYQRLIEDSILVDLHQHPLVVPADLNDLADYLRARRYEWGYEAARHGGWTAVCTANLTSCLLDSVDVSSIRFTDLVDEIGIMLADMAVAGVPRLSGADDVVAAKQAGTMGFLPTVEHLAIGHDLHRVDVLYGIGVRMAGLTHARKNAIGDGQVERTDAGLSEFGVEVVRRMNELGMIIDLSHVGVTTAREAIALSKAPTVFSHNGARSVWATKRTRSDDDFTACAEKGGLVCIWAVPNAMSNDRDQDINCVLDHFDHVIKLVGPDHVAIGTDILVGDHVGLIVKQLGRDAPEYRPDAPYLNGLESPADGKNIVRGLIARGHSDETIKKVAGQNAIDLLRRVVN